jgi:hypothetical protein
VAAESENTFPMDFYADDPLPRPWKFQPKGYLVMILTDADEGRRAESGLVAAGFGARDDKLCTGQQILENYETYVGHRNITDSVAGSVRTTPRARSSISGTHVRIAVRCGCACQTRVRFARRCWSSPTSTTYTVATTGQRGKQTLTCRERTSAARRQLGAAS